MARYRTLREEKRDDAWRNLRGGEGGGGGAVERPRGHWCVCVCFVRVTLKIWSPHAAKATKGNDSCIPTAPRRRCWRDYQRRGIDGIKKKGGGGTLAAWNRGAFLISPRFDGNFSN